MNPRAITDRIVAAGKAALRRVAMHAIRSALAFLAPWILGILAAFIILSLLVGIIVSNPLQALLGALTGSGSDGLWSQDQVLQDRQDFENLVGQYGKGIGSCAAQSDYENVSEQYFEPWQAAFAAKYDGTGDTSKPVDMSNADVVKALSPCFHYQEATITTVTTTVSYDRNGTQVGTSTSTEKKKVLLLIRADTFRGVYEPVWQWKTVVSTKSEPGQDGGRDVVTVKETKPYLASTNVIQDYTLAQKALEKIWNSDVTKEDAMLYISGELALETGNQNALDVMDQVSGADLSGAGIPDGWAPSPQEGWVWPVPGHYTITSPFGWRQLNGQPDFHPGIDVAVPTGTEVLAAHDGTVDEAWMEPGCGYTVSIVWDGGEVRYCHNSQILVSHSQQVKAGDVVALSGNTGESTGPHLHIEVYLNGKLTNPLVVFGWAGGSSEYLKTVHAIPVPDEWKPWFEEAAKTYGVPVEILEAIGRIESSFDPNAIGPPTSVGEQAEGMMQFLPSTFKVWGEDFDNNGIISPFDAPDEIAAAAALLENNGVDLNPRNAIYDYNKSWDYVDAVLRVADEYRAMNQSATAGR